MATNVVFANLVLVLTAAVLLYAAISDLKHYRIPNELVLLLIVLFLLHTLLLSRWVNAAWSLALAAIVLVFLIYFHARHWMGGGDVKLLSVAFLWTGVDCALAFALLLLGFALLHITASKFGWVQSRRPESDGRARIAFAPSVAAALICIFALGVRLPG
jgi:prepilin peptidase CpaA